MGKPREPYYVWPKTLEPRRMVCWWTVTDNVWNDTALILQVGVFQETSGRFSQVKRALQGRKFPKAHSYKNLLGVPFHSNMIIFRMTVIVERFCWHNANDITSDLPLLRSKHCLFVIGIPARPLWPWHHVAKTQPERLTHENKLYPNMKVAHGGDCHAFLRIFHQVTKHGPLINYPSKRPWRRWLLPRSGPGSQPHLRSHDCGLHIKIQCCTRYAWIDLPVSASA